MNTLEFAQEARRDFIAAGPEGHFACPAGHATGMDRDARCVMARALNFWIGSTKWSSICELEEAWKHANGVYPIDTNALGFDACVAAYDRVILHLQSSARPSKAVLEGDDRSQPSPPLHGDGTGGRAAPHLVNA